MSDHNTSAPELAPDDRFLRLPEVERLVGMKSSAIYHRVKAGEFPQPVRIAPRYAVWVMSEVKHWMRERLAGSRKAA